MNIIPKDQTIHGLLNNPMEQLIIPAYQRRYAWSYNQTFALFEDIDMLQPNDGHLFGMLILHTGYHQGGINEIDVVDGQQRLTTITLLLHALKTKFSEVGKEHINHQIQTMLFCGNDSSTPKIILGELDNKDFKKILKGEQEGIKNQNLINALNYFNELISERISEEGEDWLDKFYNKLTHTAKIIRLDVQQAQDAYKLFETINNRGLRLSATDILKNFILGHAAKIGEQKLEEVKEQWSSLITTLDGIPTDDFFRQYISSIYTRRVTKSKLIEYFKEDYLNKVDNVDLIGEYAYYSDYYNGAEESNDPEDEEEEAPSDKPNQSKKNKNSHSRIDISYYIQHILNCAEVYANIWNKTFNEEKLNKKLRDLSDIKSFPTYIFLMHFLQRDKTLNEKLEVLDMISALMLRRHVCARRTSENDTIFSRVLRIEDDDNFIDNFKEELILDYPNDEEFEDRFPNHELKSSLHNRAKYILREIEYTLTGGTGEITINAGNDVHLEHIIPQKIKSQKSKEEFGDWESYLGEKSLTKHPRFVNRIGNMTLIAGDLNISVSNNPFVSKRKAYNKSNIKLTKEIGENYTGFKFKDVEERGKELAKTALEIWRIEN
ncbi:MAG: hypothetical protein DSY77_16095 [Bacteroidetes bacterium]|nr:MAG: hypothetical protein DSY77_16095 [Bacteroidota bacterium]